MSWRERDDEGLKRPQNHVHIKVSGRLLEPPSFPQDQKLDRQARCLVAPGTFLTPPTLLSCPLIKILPLPGLSTIIPARGALKKKRGKTENGAPGAALGNEMSSQKTGSRLAERLL